MYLDFYCLSQAPFHSSSDSELFFLSPSHQAALGAITYGIASRQGFVAIFGEAGVGKTTLLRAYLTHVRPQELKTIFVFNAQLAFYDLLRLIFRDLGLPVTTDDPHALVHQLQQVLHEAARQGRNVALIIDEAQSMPVETLEQLRLLANPEDATEKPLQIVLVGQPELHHKLQQGTLRHLEQRTVVRSTVLPLTRQESRAYIYHRLVQVVQDDTPIFTEAALQRIIRHAKGVPRELNTLCTNALIAGFAAQQRPITAALVKSVIADLRGTRRVPVWRLGLASSVALALLASLLWLAPWQVRHGVPTIVPQSTSAQGGDRTTGAVKQTVAPAGPRQVTETGATSGKPDPPKPGLMTEQREASGATSAPPRHALATSEAPIEVLDTQAMQELLTRLETARSTREEPLDTKAMDNLVARLDPTDKTTSPPVSRAKAAKKKGTKSLSRASEGQGESNFASADHPPARQLRRPSPYTSRGAPSFALSPQRSDPVPPGRAPEFQFFDTPKPVNDSIP